MSRRDDLPLKLDMLFAEGAIKYSWLARRLGVSRQYVYRVMNGFSPMSDDLYNRIIAVFQEGAE